MPGRNSSDSPHLRGCPVCVNMIELVVLGNRPTRRKGSDRRGHSLHFAPERDLALQQRIASRAILWTSLGKVTPMDDSIEAHGLD